MVAFRIKAGSSWGREQCETGRSQEGAELAFPFLLCDLGIISGHFGAWNFLASQTPQGPEILGFCGALTRVSTVCGLAAERWD